MFHNYSISYILSVYLSICWSICLSVCLSVDLSIPYLVFLEEILDTVQIFADVIGRDGSFHLI